MISPVEVLSPNVGFETLGYVDDITSIIWTERYNEYGDFEIELPMSNEVWNLFDLNTLLRIPDSKQGMIVEKRQIIYDQTDGDRLIISGPSLDGLLRRRIIQGHAAFPTMNATDLIKKLIVDNFSSAAGEARAVPFILSDTVVFEVDNQDYRISPFEVTGDVVGNVISDVLKTTDLGLRIEYADEEGRDAYIYIYSGNDLRATSSNSSVIFSRDLDNLNSSDYVEDISDFQSEALVAGAGEGAARIYTRTQSRNPNAQLKGFKRSELFVDARDISKTRRVGNKDVAIPDKEYENLLKSRGDSSLLTHSFVNRLDGGVLEGVMYTYGVDYVLGDRVSVFDSYGRTMNARVNEVVRSLDISGYKIDSKFRIVS